MRAGTLLLVPQSLHQHFPKPKPKPSILSILRAERNEEDQQEAVAWQQALVPSEEEVQYIGDPK